MNKPRGFPFASSFGSGLCKLLRYASGFNPATPGTGRLPALIAASGAFVFSFPYDPALNDRFNVVETTADSDDWSAPKAWFESRLGPIPSADDGLLAIPVPIESERIFFRLRVIQKDLQAPQ